MNQRQEQNELTSEKQLHSEFQYSTDTGSETSDMRRQVCTAVGDNIEL